MAKNGGFSKGRWVTVRGHHVFVQEDKGLAPAMKKSKQFKFMKPKEAETKESEKNVQPTQKEQIVTVGEDSAKIIKLMEKRKAIANELDKIGKSDIAKPKKATVKDYTEVKGLMEQRQKITDELNKIGKGDIAKPRKATVSDKTSIKKSGLKGAIGENVEKKPRKTSKPKTTEMTDSDRQASTEAQRMIEWKKANPNGNIRSPEAVRYIMGISKKKKR